MMLVRSINIRREGDYGYGEVNPTKPFLAQIVVGSERGEIKLNLSAELSARVVEVIADEVVAAGKATAEAMTADILTVTAIEGPKEPQ